jgi:hypothetical protein
MKAKEQACWGLKWKEEEAIELATERNAGNVYEG